MIIILGTARSGTTFLAKLFDSHPQVLYRHEPDHFLSKKDISGLLPNNEKNKNKEILANYLKKLKHVQNPKASGHKPRFRKNYRTRTSQTCFELCAYVGKVCSLIPIKNIEHKITIPDFINRAGTNEIYTVIKSISLLPYANLFIDSDPKVKVIHIIRHPCGVIASKLRGVKKGILDKSLHLDAIFKYTPAHLSKFTKSYVQSFSHEERIAFQWMILNEKVFAELNGNSQYCMIKYEDLCYDPIKNIEKLFSFCKIYMSEQTMDFIDHLYTIKSKNEKYYSVMRTPKQAANKWKSEINNDIKEKTINIISSSKVGKLYI